MFFLTQIYELRRKPVFTPAAYVGLDLLAP